jgi:low temperature requirement protein LtrA
MGFSTVLPLYDRLGFGVTEGWWCHGVRAFAERFAACYIVSCCMVLELLELVAQSMTISLLLLVCTLESLLVAYLMYWIYDPLIAPAQRAHESRNHLVSRGRRSALHFSYLFSHLVMCSGLVVAAGALREILAQLTGSHAGLFGPPIETGALVELYAGIAACLLGQTIFSFFTGWKVDGLRLSGCLVSLAILPLLLHRPVVLAVTVLLSGCAVLLYIDRVRRRIDTTTAIPLSVFSSHSGVVPDSSLADS